MNDELRAATAALAPLVETAERSPRRQDREGVRALPGAYRRLVSALAEARAAGVPARTLATAEQLVLRAHGILYVPQPQPIGAALVSLWQTLPSTAQRYRAHVGLAVVVLLAGFAFGYLEVHRDIGSAPLLLSPTWLDNAEGFATGQTHRNGSPLYGAFYFTNNSKVALMAYAAGISFGLGTAAALFFNGLVLGVTLAWVQPRGGSARLGEWLLAHGGVELLAIFLAAGAGLAMGEAMLRPGWHSRTESLRRAALDTLPLALGAVLLLVVAGLLEGWVTPLPIGWPIKAVIGLGTTLPTLWWLWRPRRVAH